MKTIEERAKDLCYEIDQCYTLGFCDDLQYDEDKALSCAKTILVEQDQIARQEERERCIKAAQEWHCQNCGCCYNEKERVERKQGNCTRLNELRKAMEE